MIPVGIFTLALAAFFLWGMYRFYVYGTRNVHFWMVSGCALFAIFDLIAGMYALLLGMGYPL